MSKQMKNHSRETETIENNQVEILELKCVSKIFNLPDGLNSWLETAKEKACRKLLLLLLSHFSCVRLCATP